MCFVWSLYEIDDVKVKRVFCAGYFLLFFLFVIIVDRFDCGGISTINKSMLNFFFLS